MSSVSTVKRKSADAVVARRRYDSPLRKAKSEETRTRILEAGSWLAHRLKNWDWTQLTARAVAARAKVNERTVYRYFATERELQEAILRRLEEESGISYETLSFDSLLEATHLMYASLPKFAASPAIVRDPVGLSGAHRRQSGLQQAINAATSNWSERERLMAASMLDIQWLPTTYERLITDWKMDSATATQAASWAMHVLMQAILNDIRPGKAAAKTSARKRTNSHR